MAVHLTLNSNRSLSMVARRGSAGPRGTLGGMSASDLRRMLRAGDLVADGPRLRAPSWLPVLRRARDVGAAVLPIDVRLSSVERRGAHRHGAADRDRRRGRHARRVDGVTIDPAIALVIATSGTSGHPRLAELPAQAVEAAVLASADAIDARPEDRWLSCLPLAHIGGLLVARTPPAARARRSRSGAASLDPSSARLSDARFTSLVPTQLTRLLDAGADLGRFRAILVGGSGIGCRSARRVQLVPACALCRPTG